MLLAGEYDLRSVVFVLLLDGRDVLDGRLVFVGRDILEGLSLLEGRELPEGRAVLDGLEADAGLNPSDEGLLLLPATCNPPLGPLGLGFVGAGFNPPPGCGLCPPCPGLCGGYEGYIGYVG